MLHSPLAWPLACTLTMVELKLMDSGRLQEKPQSGFQPFLWYRVPHRDCAATLFRIIETLRLEKASKIIKSNHEWAKLEQQG